jgi:hypothetical protein
MATAALQAAKVMSAPGIRWLIDPVTGQIVGYRNPLTDQNEELPFGSGGGGDTVTYVAPDYVAPDYVL